MSAYLFANKVKTPCSVDAQICRHDVCLVLAHQNESLTVPSHASSQWYNGEGG